jgi:DNA adenine methylase
MKSFIRWAGSKRPIVAKLRAFWPGGAARYIEPFAGSACLFFDIEPRGAVLGDLNWELVCTMREIQADVYRVLECLDRLPTGKASYYRIRAIQPQLLSGAEVAARFLYLNRYCFNGLYRTNRDGRFNVPYGPPRSRSPIDNSVIIKASQALASALLVCGDFEHTIQFVRAGDFVYLDPPYVTSKRRVFSEYSPSSFCANDLKRLALSLRKIDACGACFLITYADSPEARRLLAPWRHRRVWTRRNIAGFSGSRRGSYELMATNIA